MKPANAIFAKAKSLRIAEIRAEIETLRTEFGRIIKGQVAGAEVGQQAKKNAAVADTPLPLTANPTPRECL